MRRSIATVSLSGSLNEKLTATAAAGFDGIELFEPDFVVSPMSAHDVAARVADLGLRIELYQPLRNFEAVPPDQLARGLRRAAAKFTLMTRLGADLLLVCSNVDPDTIDDRDLAAEQLRALAELAADHGIRIAYEALAWGRHVRHYADACDIVRRAGHPALGLCLDSFHICCAGDDFAPIRDIEADRLFFVQLADAPDTAVDVLQLSRHHRSFPGQGVFDLPAFTAAVLRAGYRGPLSVEVFSDTVRSAAAETTARDALRSIRYLEDRTAALLGNAASAPVTPLHPPARVDGVAFVEVAVAESAAAGLTELLTDLGFVRVGVHRSKRVTLWQQGDIRLVLNSETPPSAGPSVVAIGLNTADVPGTVRRALDLRWPLDEQPRGPGEAELPSITTPAGLKLIFCTAGGPQPWLADFTEVAAAGPGVGLSTIDHLGYSVPADLHDAEVSVYRSLLGATAGPVAEVNRPHGQLHSRALVTPGGAVRVAVSADTVGRSTAPDLRQVALGTTDVGGTVSALRRSGVPMLAIPDNYYDDLATRWDLTVGLLAELRSLGLLYDRCEGGEFRHAYSAAAGGLFFEFVQRDGGYDGYGEPDTPIRLALQDAADGAAPTSQ